MVRALQCKKYLLNVKLTHTTTNSPIKTFLIIFTILCILQNASHLDVITKLLDSVGFEFNIILHSKTAYCMQTLSLWWCMLHFRVCQLFGSLHKSLGIYSMCQSQWKWQTVCKTRLGMTSLWIRTSDAGFLNIKITLCYYGHLVSAVNVC